MALLDTLPRGQLTPSTFPTGDPPDEHRLLFFRALVFGAVRHQSRFDARKKKSPP